VVLKPWTVWRGIGVSRRLGRSQSANVNIETRNGVDETMNWMAQRYIPEIREGDKRILLIGGKAVPHCLARIPKPGETRGNLAPAARRREAASRRDLEIANALGPEPRERACSSWAWT